MESNDFLWSCLTFMPGHICFHEFLFVINSIMSDSKNLDKLQHCITTVVSPGFFESDVISWNHTGQFHEIKDATL